MGRDERDTFFRDQIEALANIQRRNHLILAPLALYAQANFAEDTQATLEQRWAQMQAVNEQVAHNMQDAEGVKDSTVSVQTNLGTVNGNVGSIGTDLGNLLGDLGDLSLSVQDIQGDIQAINLTIGNVNGSINTIKINIGGI